MDAALHSLRSCYHGRVDIIRLSITISVNLILCRRRHDASPLPRKAPNWGIDNGNIVLELGFLKLSTMFQGMDSREFYGSFRTEDHCLEYLYKIKWQQGFSCHRCAHDKFWPGQTRYHARCRICNYDESVIANTVFHKIQFSLLKAFDLTFHLTVLQKGIASRNLAKVVGVNPRTALNFMHKVRKSMGDWVSSHLEKDPMGGNCTIDSVIITHRASKMNGLQKVNTTIKRTAKQKYIHLKGSMQDENTLEPCHLIAGRYVDEGKNILAWNFKSWLTGVHHHCSEKHRQNYFDEYSFKFCFRNNKNIMWHKLIEWMVIGKRNKYERTRPE